MKSNGKKSTKSGQNLILRLRCGTIISGCSTVKMYCRSKKCWHQHNENSGTVSVRSEQSSRSGLHMQPKNPKLKDDPEARVQEQIKTFLELRKWLVKPTHGGMFQAGFPDLYCTHIKYGVRWVEVKLPEMKGSRFTNAQKEWFPKLSANGTPIWILTGATESEYRKLFEAENWLYYFMMKL